MGSNINDRRNWDSYLVDGEVVKLQTNQAKEMQGFPKEFKLPDSRSKSLKLLGNSVAVNAVHAVAKQMILYMDNKESFIKGDQLKLL
jgi:DNA (cytosine-5)-methyltransferase 1